ncbi:MAG: hypothetical protein ACUVTX_12550 [Bacteroidales bacterium]
MKRILILVFLGILLSFSAVSQEYKTSLGLRAGWPYGFTIKHFMSRTNAVEGILASSYQGFVITGIFENEYWTGSFPGLNWFWGVGAHVGFWDSNPYVDTTGSVIGLDGILGLEYTFDEIPLNLSIDILPSLNIFGSFGWGGIGGALSIRYVF